MSRRTVAPMLVSLLVLAGCGSDDPTSAATSDTEAVSENLTVLAAASLTEVLEALQGDLSELDVTLSFGGSSALASQIQQGAPADVFAAADERTMEKLVDDGLVDEPVVFARNELAILVEPGNPEGITDLNDLERKDLVVVLVEPSVPAGAYTRTALAKAGAHVSPSSLELDVKAAAAKVMSGEADAAIVYATDVQAAGSHGHGVTIPPQHNVVARYPVAIVRGTANRDAAERFVRQLTGAAGRAALRRHGFLPAR